MNPPIDMAAFKAKHAPPKESNEAGECRCMECGHEWQEDPITENDWIKCPSCELVKGRHKHPFECGEEHWACECGNTLFAITVTGMYCPNCASWFTPHDAAGLLTNWIQSQAAAFVEQMQDSMDGLSADFYLDEDEDDDDN